MSLKYARSRAVGRKESDCRVGQFQVGLPKNLCSFDQSIRIIAQKCAREIRQVDDCTIFDSQVTGIFNRSGVAKDSWMTVRSVGQYPEVILGSLDVDIVAVGEVRRHLPTQSVLPIRCWIQRLFHYRSGSMSSLLDQLMSSGTGSPMQRRMGRPSGAVWCVSSGMPSLL